MVPLDRKICGWIRKRNARKMFGQTAWRNRWFELDQQRRRLEYFHNHQDGGHGGAADGGGGGGDGDDGGGGGDDDGDEAALSSKRCINMTHHVVVNCKGFEWELVPVEGQTDRVWRFKADDEDHKRMWMASMTMCSREGVETWRRRRAETEQ